MKGRERLIKDSKHTYTRKYIKLACAQKQQIKKKNSKMIIAVRKSWDNW